MFGIHLHDHHEAVAGGGIGGGLFALGDWFNVPWLRVLGLAVSVGFLTLGCYREGRMRRAERRAAERHAVEMARLRQRLDPE